MRYKTLFIDWDGTLSHSMFWQRWEHHPIHGSKYRLLQDALFKNPEGVVAVTEWMLGRKTYDDIVGYASDVTGIDQKLLAKELEYSATHMAFMDAEAVQLIQQLREKGTKVLIATDNMDTFRLWTVPALGLTRHFDGILTSDTLGALKAQPRPDGSSQFFDDFLTRHGLQPHEAVLIDNDLDNKAVERWGIDFLHVNQDHSLTDHLIALLQTSPTV